MYMRALSSIHSLIISMLSRFHRHGSSLVNFIFNFIHVSRSLRTIQIKRTASMFVCERMKSTTSRWTFEHILTFWPQRPVNSWTAKYRTKTKISRSFSPSHSGSLKCSLRSLCASVFIIVSLLHSSCGFYFTSLPLTLTFDRFGRVMWIITRH